MNWLVESGQKYIVKPITSKLKNLKEKITKIFEKNEFEVREGPSALKNFIRQFVIKGKPGYDPTMFFEAVKKKVLELLAKNSSTKVKFILECQMEKKRFKNSKYCDKYTIF